MWSKGKSDKECKSGPGAGKDQGGEMAKTGYYIQQLYMLLNSQVYYLGNSGVSHRKG